MTNKYHWFGIDKVFTKCAMFGVGIGWGRKPYYPCLILQLGQWCVYLGPHVRER